MSFEFFFFQLNCFACSAIYRFQLIFVRRRRKQFVLVNQRHRSGEHLTTGQPIVKMIKPAPRVNSTAQQNNGGTQMVSTIPSPSQRPDPSKLRQMLSFSGQQQQQQRVARIGPKTVVMAQNTVRGRQLPQNVIQQRVQRQAGQEIGSSEEDIETQVIDSSMVEVQMETNSNSPQPSAIRSKPMSVTTTKTLHQKYTPTSTTMTTVTTLKPDTAGSSAMEVKYRQATSSTVDDSLKCDLCPREFHSLRQRQRHRLTHSEQSAVFNCSKCNRPFMDLKSKEVHERMAHGIRKSDGGVRIKQEKNVEGVDDSDGGGASVNAGDNEEVLMEIAVEEEVQVGSLYVHDEG